MSAWFSTLDQVMKNLNKEITKIQNGTMKGLIRAAILIRADMDKTPPLIPVDTGNLRSSWFVSTFNSQRTPFVIMGFTASYARFVHDNIGAQFQREVRVKTKKGKYKIKKVGRPGAGALFFTASLNRNQAKILKIIKEEAQIR